MGNSGRIMLGLFEEEVVVECLPGHLTLTEPRENFFLTKCLDTGKWSTVQDCSRKYMHPLNRTVNIN